MLLSTAESATYSAAEIERRLHSDLRCGLSWQEALGRSKIIGYNELRAPQEDSTFKKYVEQFKNPLILLLLGMNHISSVCVIIYLAQFCIFYWILEISMFVLDFPFFSSSCQVCPDFFFSKIYPFKNLILV